MRVEVHPALKNFSGGEATYVAEAEGHYGQPWLLHNITGIAKRKLWSTT